MAYVELWMHVYRTIELALNYTSVQMSVGLNKCTFI